MPRLRYLKNFDYHASEEDEYENTDETEEPQSGKSWLSNSAIIASLTDAKIKESIKHYKALIKILEEELLARSLTSRKSIKFHSIEVCEGFSKSNGLRRKTTRASFDSDRRSPNGNHERQEIRRILRQLRLSPEEKRILFTKWSEILSKQIITKDEEKEEQEQQEEK
jgi:sulfur transfer complex TusBCD TusB component (DsrH family)